MNRKIKIGLPVLAACAAGVVFCCTQNPAPDPLRIEDPSVQAQVLKSPSEEQEPETRKEIWVYVCGNVNDPGVYALPEGARVFEAVEKAGGADPDAAAGYLNLAEVLKDGQQIYVPGRLDIAEDAAVPPDLWNPYAETDGRININTASLEELKTLPGIGDAKAQAIISYREKSPFQTPEDIMQVPGIKENSYSRIRELIRV